MLFFYILFYFIFYKLTVDCGELLRFFAQLDKQEDQITYSSHGNSNTVDTAGDCCYVTEVIADL
jgi:hypothetical protein